MRVMVLIEDIRQMVRFGVMLGESGLTDLPEKMYLEKIGYGHGLGWSRHDL